MSVPAVVAAADVADWLTVVHYVHAILPNAVAQAELAATNLLGARRRYDGAEAMNSLKHLGVPIVALGTIDDPNEVLRWQSGSTLRSVYLRDGRIIGAQLAGDIRSAGVYRSLMLRRRDVTRFAARLIEPGFGIQDLTEDAMPLRHVGRH
jgi:NAD(P)H-nitrite reductase large subunit